jgi:hypothetical protein
VYPEDSFDSALYAEKERVYRRLFDSFKRLLSGEKEK